METMIKNVKLAELNINIVNVLLNIQTLKDDLMEFKCLCCNRISQ